MYICNLLPLYILPFGHFARHRTHALAPRRVPPPPLHMFVLIPRVRPLVPRIISCMVSFAPFACCHTVARVRLLLLLERIAAAQLSHPLLYAYSYSQIMLASVSPGSWHSHPTYILLDYYLARTGTPGPAAATATDFVVSSVIAIYSLFQTPSRIVSRWPGPPRTHVQESGLYC